jgi:hypothetical protein
LKQLNATGESLGLRDASGVGVPVTSSSSSSPRRVDELITRRPSGTRLRRTNPDVSKELEAMPVFVLGLDTNEVRHPIDRRYRYPLLHC